MLELLTLPQALLLLTTISLPAALCEPRLLSVNSPLLRWRCAMATSGRIQLGLAVLSIAGILFGYWCDSYRGDSIRDFFMFYVGPASLVGLLVSLVAQVVLVGMAAIAQASHPQARP